MKLLKNIAAILLILLVAFGAFKLTSWSSKEKESTNVEIQSDVLLEKIRSVTKLVTVEGYFSEVFDFKDYWGYDLSMLRKRALVRVKAKVSVGYDLTKMRIEARPEEKRIEISQLPDPTIISIDHDLDYYDITEGTFNRFTTDDFNKINAKAKENIQSKALESDLFLNAESQSNQVLEIIEFIVEGAGWELVFVPNQADQIKN